MATTRYLLLLAVLQCAVVFVSAHSWLDCINVTNPKDITSLANMGCSGYPANYVGRSNPDANMYKVAGITTEQWPSTNCCPTTTRSYSAQYPMTKVKAGDSFTIGYTPNGHTSWMSPPPPHGSSNYYIKWNPDRTGTSMVTMNDMWVATTLVMTLFETPCHDRNTGAQLDPSSGLCAAAIQIPAGTAPGVYQFVWYWPFRFQGPSIVEDYLTCFDVEVLPSGTITTTTTTPPTTTTTTTTKPPTTTTTTTTKPPTTTTTTTTKPPTTTTTTAQPTPTSTFNPLPTSTTTVDPRPTPTPTATIDPTPTPTTTINPRPTTTIDPRPTPTPTFNPLPSTPTPNSTTSGQPDNITSGSATVVPALLLAITLLIAFFC